MPHLDAKHAVAIQRSGHRREIPAGTKLVDSNPLYVQFHGWGLKVAVLDTIWGTLMYTIIGFALYFVETTSLWQRL